MRRLAIVVSLAIWAAFFPLYSSSTPLEAQTKVLPKAHLAPKEELLLWVGLEPAEYEAVEELIKEFEEETGVSVRATLFADITTMRARYRVAVPAGMGPDVVLASHDWIGEFAEKGFIAPIPEHIFSEEERAEFLDKSIEAVTHGGIIWGYPCMLESIVLIYNKDVIPDPPTTWDELIERAKQLAGADIDGFRYPHVDPYYSFPFFSGYGGYVFGEDDNVQDIGLATPGAIEGARFIQDMVHKHEILPLDTTLNHYVVRDSFYAEEVAMIIDGPWTFARLREMEMNYGVTTLPMLPNGEYPRTFVGVQVAMVNTISEDPTAAVELAEYLSNPQSQLRLHEAGWRVPTRHGVLVQVENRPEVRAVFEQAENGILMPKIPEMDSVWSSWVDALKLIVRGVSVETALEDAVAWIKEEIRYAEVPMIFLKVPKASVVVENLFGKVGQVISVAGNRVKTVSVQSARAITVEFEEEQPVNTLSITTDQDMENVSVTLEWPMAKPAALPEPTVALPEMTVSHYFELAVTPKAAVSVEVETATIVFRVPKDWLNTNKIDSETVRLLKYEGGWVELSTEATGEEDATYKYYSATVPGLTTFAVVGEVTEMPPEEKPPKPLFNYLLLVVPLILIILVVIGISRRRKPSVAPTSPSSSPPRLF
jgi:PGF-pre-PGF domain-containing protein